MSLPALPPSPGGRWDGPRNSNTKRPGHRPGYLHDPERIRAIIEGVMWGNHPEIAASAAGVGRSTFYEWRQWGESPVKPEDVSVESWKAAADFVDWLAQAEAIAESRLVRVGVADAIGNLDGLQAIRVLERRWKGRWAPNRQVEVGGPGAFAVPAIIDTADVAAAVTLLIEVGAFDDTDDADAEVVDGEVVDESGDD